MELEYVLTEEQLETCRAFAAQRVLGSFKLYKARGEAKLSKIEEDIITGASAELAVYDILNQNHIESTEPDFKIYKPREKSFSADLACGQFNLHIKAQTVKSAQKYGASWLFQKEDKLFKRCDANDLLVFCIVDGLNVSVKTVISVPEIVELNLLKEPKVYQYKFTKVALYLEHILEQNKNGVEKWILNLQKIKKEA